MQRSQLELPMNGAKRPDPQTLHTIDELPPYIENVPFGHLMQDNAPEPAEYCPGSQVLQPSVMFKPPAFVPYFPGGQLLHASASFF